jgi:hypothetical protein
LINSQKKREFTASKKAAKKREKKVAKKKREKKESALARLPARTGNANNADSLLEKEPPKPQTAFVWISVPTRRYLTRKHLLKSEKIIQLFFIFHLTFSSILVTLIRTETIV